MQIKHLFSATLLAVANIGAAQLVWTEPAFPTMEDEVTLYYNSALGNGELEGVIPVYIHTGVITSNSSGPSDWQNVQTAWGTSDADALMNPEGAGIHRSGTTQSSAECTNCQSRRMGQPARTFAMF